MPDLFIELLQLSDDERVVEFIVWHRQGVALRPSFGTWSQTPANHRPRLRAPWPSASCSTRILSSARLSRTSAGSLAQRSLF